MTCQSIIKISIPQTNRDCKQWKQVRVLNEKRNSNRCQELRNRLIINLKNILRPMLNLITLQKELLRERKLTDSEINKTWDWPQFKILKHQPGQTEKTHKVKIYPNRVWIISSRPIAVSKSSRLKLRSSKKRSTICLIHKNLQILSRIRSLTTTGTTICWHSKKLSNNRNLVWLASSKLSVKMPKKGLTIKEII